MNKRQIAVKVLPAPAKRQILRYRRRTLDAIVQYRIRTGRLGPLPSFLIIGFGKCGTTELYDRLVEHPSIHPSLRKEVNYFMHRHQEGVAWYRAHFAVPNRKDTREPCLVGEASPGYVLNPFAPQRMAELVPDVKLIVLLRDPVARAYSHFQHQRRLGMEPLETFEAALDAEPERLRGERQRVHSDPGYQGFAYYVDSYVNQGIYADYLPMWMNTFPRDQLLVVQSEKFYRETDATLRMITDYLEIPALPPTQGHRHKSFSYPPMKPETKARLQEFFAPHNERLFALLGTDFGWNSRASMKSTASETMSLQAATNGD